MVVALKWSKRVLEVSRKMWHVKEPKCWSSLICKVVILVLAVLGTLIGFSSLKLGEKKIIYPLDSWFKNDFADQNVNVDKSWVSVKVNVKIKLERQLKWAVTGGCLITFMFTGQIFSSGTHQNVNVNSFQFSYYHGYNIS